MFLPEDMVVTQLNQLLESSDPGQELHHLHVVTSDGKPGPLGPPTPDQLETTVYAIMPVGPDVDPDVFTQNVVVSAAIENIKKARLPVFAALSQEMWQIPRESWDEQAEKLASSGGSYGEHPAAIEVTVLYGACRDGRRWTGRRYLTGSRAGETEQIELLVGRPRPREGLVSPAPLIRKLVGMTM